MYIGFVNIQHEREILMRIWEILAEYDLTPAQQQMLAQKLASQGHAEFRAAGPASPNPVATPSGGGSPLSNYGDARNQNITPREPTPSPWKYGGEAPIIRAKAPTTIPSTTALGAAPPKSMADYAKGAAPTTAPTSIPNFAQPNSMADYARGSAVPPPRAAPTMPMGMGRGGGGFTGNIDIMGHPLPVTSKVGGENTAESTICRRK